MLKTRTREWLQAHPEVLTMAFLLFITLNELLPGGLSTQGSASSYLGP